MSDGSNGGVWRLLRHGDDDGAWNMAVDEAMLLRYAAATEPPAPTLRLYGWRPVALSLGRNQHLEARSDLASLQRRGIDLIRRPTGGRAVLHQCERTYSVVGSLADPFDGSVIESYLRVARTLASALASLGVNAEVARGRARPRDDAVACFAATASHEIVVDGRKLVGSAQARRRGAFVQHGSIPLSAADDEALAAIGGRSAGATATDLARCLGTEPDVALLDEALIDAFERRFACRLAPSELTADEAALASRLRCWRYDSACWTLQGRPGEREGRWGPTLDWSAL